MWRADVCNSISLKKKKEGKKRAEKAMKRRRRNKMSGALFFFFFFFTDPWPLRKCFHVLCLSTESKEGKHSLLQTTCNRFFLKPNKSTLCFRSCDTFLCFVLFPTYPVSTHPPIPTLCHTHAQTLRTHTHERTRVHDTCTLRVSISCA